MTMDNTASEQFIEAVPVWEEGREEEMNYSLILRYAADGNEDTELRVSASSRYQIFVDGIFFAAGPSEADKGFFAVDRYDLQKELSDNKSVISIIAAGYNTESSYCPDEPPFICAEIVRDGEVVFATGRDDCEAAHWTGRVQKTQRFSYDRPFSESYIFDAYYDGFMTDPYAFFKGIRLKQTENIKFTGRKTPFAGYEYRKPAQILSRGIMVPDKDAKTFPDRPCDTAFRGFPKKELESSPIDEILSYRTQIMEPDSTQMESVPLGINCCCIYDMGEDRTGHIRLSFTAENDTVIYVIFSEELDKDGLPVVGENDKINVVRWAIQGGRPYDIVTFEPYMFRYVQVISMYAPTLITNVAVFSGLKKDDKSSGKA